MTGKSNILNLHPVPIENNGGIGNVAKTQLKILSKSFNIYGINHIKPYGSLFNKQIPNIFKITKYAKIKNTDIVLVHGFSSFLPFIALIIALIVRADLIWMPHYHPFSKHNNRFLAFCFFCLFNFYVALFSKKIIVATKNEQDFFRKCFRSQKNIPIITHFQETTHYSELTPIIFDNYCLFVGRDDHNKNLDLVIDSSEYFLENKLKVVVVCETNRKLPDNFINLKNLNDLELASLYKYSKVTLIPSHYEAFSLVAMESLIYGTRVVCSENVMISTIDEMSSYFIRFKLNKNSFEEAIRKTLIKESVSDQELESIKDFFSKRRYIASYLDAIE